MAALMMRHVESSNPPQFLVMRLKDGKTTSPAAIVSPAATPVKDLPDSHNPAVRQKRHPGSVAAGRAKPTIGNLSRTRQRCIPPARRLSIRLHRPYPLP